jgi:hypothetical protein
MRALTGSEKVKDQGQAVPTKPADVAVGCCGPIEQKSCCELRAKGACCNQAHPEGCGCR